MWLRSLICLLGTGFSLLAGPSKAEQRLDPHAQWYADYLSQSRLVALSGGRKLNLYCVGSGSPTVVLESGLSESAETWWRVQPALAKVSRVCAYDRAGLGRSPPGPMPRDTKAEVSDLEALLRAGGVSSPYLLVGHSMGGYNVRLFAARHPRQTAGVVLVDSSVEYQLLPIEKAIPSIAANDRRSLDRARRCADPARDAKVAALCIRSAPDGFPPELAKAYEGTFGLAAAQTRLSELESFISVDSDQVAAEVPSLGTTPLIVLTRTLRSTDIPAGDAELEWTRWKGLHDDLARRSARSENRVVEEAGHYIQIDRPDAVIEAVSDVLDCARTPKSGSCKLRASAQHGGVR